MTAALIFKLFVVFKVLEYGFFCFLNFINTSNIKKNINIPSRFSSFMSDDDYQKSRNYSITKHSFSLISTTYDLIIIFLFIFLGGFKLFESIALKFSMTEGMQAIIFCFLISFGKQFVDLPFSIYHTFVIEKKFGFNKMTTSLFCKDLLKGIILSIVFGSPIIYFLVWIIKVSGNNWWVYGFLGITAFQVFILWIYPTIIAPIFNKFIPLEEGELRSGIEKIAKEVNFNISEIFKMDGSKRSTHSNAYFTGFGKNRRIVLYDTLINSLTTDELLGVLAHEMGHNKLNHIKKNIVLSFSITFLGFYLWSFLLKYPPLYQAFDLSGETLFPALIIFPMIISPLSFLLAPLMNLLSRKYEYESDAFAAKAMKTGTYLKEALLKLNKENLSNLTPHPIYSFFYYSHPTLSERLDSLDSIDEADKNSE